MNRLLGAPPIELVERTNETEEEVLEEEDRQPRPRVAPPRRAPPGHRLDACDGQQRVQRAPPRVSTAGKCLESDQGGAEAVGVLPPMALADGIRQLLRFSHRIHLVRKAGEPEAGRLCIPRGAQRVVVRHRNFSWSRRERWPVPALVARSRRWPAEHGDAEPRGSSRLGCAGQLALGHRVIRRGRERRAVVPLPPLPRGGCGAATAAAHPRRLLGARLEQV